jgi:hypothetical protein
MKTVNTRSRLLNRFKKNLKSDLKIYLTIQNKNR